MSTALANVRKYFPQVAEVKDATKPLTIEVTRKDEATSKRKSHEGCAMAVACKRSLKLDGVIVSATTAYTIKGDTATRYHLPMREQKEVVSFDRGGGFAPGEYRLIVPDRELGFKPTGRGHGKGGDHVSTRHFTEGIRAILGSREVR